MQSLALLVGPLGTTEILVIVLVLVLLFGARKIPELARGLGRGVSEFKSGLHDEPKPGATPAAPAAPADPKDQPRP